MELAHPRFPIDIRFGFSLTLFMVHGSGNSASCASPSGACREEGFSSRLLCALERLLDRHVYGGIDAFGAVPWTVDRVLRLVHVELYAGEEHT